MRKRLSISVPVTGVSKSLCNPELTEKVLKIHYFGGDTISFSLPGEYKMHECMVGLKDVVAVGRFASNIVNQEHTATVKSLKQRIRVLTKELQNVKAKK